MPSQAPIPASTLPSQPLALVEFLLHRPWILYIYIGLLQIVMAARNYCLLPTKFSRENTATKILSDERSRVQTSCVSMKVSSGLYTPILYSPKWETCAEDVSRQAENRNSILSQARIRGPTFHSQQLGINNPKPPIYQVLSSVLS